MTMSGATFEGVLPAESEQIEVSIAGFRECGIGPELHAADRTNGGAELDALGTDITAKQNVVALSRTYTLRQEMS